MKNMFTNHPSSVGETYWEHMKNASTYGFNMLFGGIACLIHSVFPFIFKNTGSNVLLKMTHHFVSRMPHAEKRMLDLAEAIEKKHNQCNLHQHDSA